MPEYFNRPEMALKRAEEFIGVKKPETALSILQDFIKSRKHRQWSQQHPAIMKVYISLCVELRKSVIAKEGLYQCKSITQHTEPEALGTVIKYYLDQAKKRVTTAKEESAKALGTPLGDDLKDVEDLDQMISPEALLLNAVTSAGDGDRADREHLTPWVKFYWDAFRQCLDLLRNNVKLEELYYYVAMSACNFCRDFERNNEFRKLCESLRQHLKMFTDPVIMKNNRGNFCIQLVGNPLKEEHKNSQKMQTEIRLHQLNIAIEMRLWQEAFKAVEDIHAIQQFTRRVAHSHANRSHVKSGFLESLSKVLLNARQPLFHAATCHRIFHLNREMKKNMSHENLMKLASQTLVSTLAIPMTEKQHGLGRMLDMGNQAIEKHQKLAKMLNYERLPTRDQLVQDIQWRGVIRHVPEELQDLFKCLEIEFNPLRLADRVDRCLKWLKNDKNPYATLLQPYISQIQHVTASRVIKQVSQIYVDIDFQRLLSLVPFYSDFELEQHILDDSRAGALRAKMDHSTSTVTFGSIFDPAPLCVQPTEDASALNSRYGQENDWLNQHLNSVLRAMTRASVVLRTDEDRKAREEAFATAAVYFRKNDDNIVTQYANRKQKIEEAKEMKEREEKERTEEEERISRQKEEEARRQEQERLDVEVSKREEERKTIEEHSAKLSYVKDKLTELKKDDKAHTICGFIEPEDLLELTQDEVLEKQIDGVRKSKVEMKKALGKREEEKDHYERARRMVENTIRLKEAPVRAKERREHIAKTHEETLERSKKKHEEDISHKRKFNHMTGKISEFTQDIEVECSEVFEYEQEEFASMKRQFVEEKRKEIMDTFKEKRKQEFLAKKQEAEATIKAHADEQKRKENEANRAKEMEKLNEQNRKKIEAEKRAEEKMNQRMSGGNAGGNDNWDGGRREERRMPAADHRLDNSSQDRFPPSRGFNASPERPAGRFQPAINRRQENPARDGFERKTDNQFNGPMDNRDGPRDGPAPEREESGWRKPMDRGGPPRGAPPADRDDRDRGGFRNFDRRENDNGPRDGPRGFQPSRGGFNGDDRGRFDGARRDDGPVRRDDGPMRRNDGPMRRDDGPMRRDDGPPMRRQDDNGPMRRNDDSFDRRGPRDDGPMRRDDGPMRRNDGPIRRDDGPIRRDDGPPMRRQDDNGPMRRNDDSFDRRGPPMRDGPRDGPSRGGFSRNDDGPRNDGGSAWRGKSRDDGPRDDGFRRNDRGMGQGGAPERSFGQGRNFNDRPQGSPSRNPTEGGDPWRKAGGPPARDAAPKKPEAPRNDDDGWTTVNKR